MHFGRKCRKVNVTPVSSVYITRYNFYVTFITEIVGQYCKTIIGHLVDVIKTENVSSCMESCQFDEQCQWASFDLEFKFCTLFRDCPEIDIDETRSKCITSKVNCPLEVPCNVTGRCDVSVSSKLLRLNTYIVHIEIYQSRVLSGHYE